MQTDNLLPSRRRTEESRLEKQRNTESHRGKHKGMMGGGKKEVAKTKGFKSESGCPSEIMQGKRAHTHTPKNSKAPKWLQGKGVGEGWRSMQHSC